MAPIDKPLASDTMAAEPTTQRQQSEGALIPTKQEFEKLSDVGEKLRAALQSNYSVESFDERGLFGECYHGFSKGTDRRPVDILLLPKEDIYSGVVERTKTAMQLQHPNVYMPRDVMDCADVGYVFVFDALPSRLLNLRDRVKKLRRDPTEEMVGKLFAPIVMALHALDEKNLLSARAFIESSRVFDFGDSSIRVLNPVMFVHGGSYDFHRHRRLASHEKKVEKKEAKIEKKGLGGADTQQLAAEKEEISERFIIADLGMILYEIMYRSDAHKVSSKMIHDAKSLCKLAGKNPRARYSPELCELLLELLQNGKTEKHDVISLQELIGRPVMRRYIEAIATEIRTKKELGEAEKAALMQKTAAARHAPVKYAPAKMGKYEKERRKIVHGKHHHLSKLKSHPVEKKHGIRFDIPIEQHYKKRPAVPAKSKGIRQKVKEMLFGPEKSEARGLEAKQEMPARRRGLRRNVFRVTGVMPHQEFRHGLEHGSGAHRHRLGRRPDYVAERRRMVSGIGNGLALLRRDTLKAKSGMRFDIPLFEAAGRPDFRGQRAKMRAGEGHQLSSLRSDGLQKKHGQRFDIPLERMKRTRKAIRPETDIRPETQPIVGTSRGIIPGEGLMEREDSARNLEVCGLGERQPQEYHMTGSHLERPIEQKYGYKAWWEGGEGLEEAAPGGSNLGGIRQQDIGGGDFRLRQEKIADRPVMKQSAPQGTFGGKFIPRDLSQAERGEYDRAFGKPSSAAGQDFDARPIAGRRGRGGEFKAWWEKGDLEQQQLQGQPQEQAGGNVGANVPQEQGTVKGQRILEGESAPLAMKRG